MEKDTYRSQFRIPYDLYEKLKADADSKHTSVNAELVARLQESFEPKEILTEALLDAIVNQVFKSIEKAEAGLKQKSTSRNKNKLVEATSPKPPKK